MDGACEVIGEAPFVDCVNVGAKRWGAGAREKVGDEKNTAIYLFWKLALQQ